MGHFAEELDDRVLISTHVLSGALLGRALGRPAPALLTGIASHLVLDRLPHWGLGEGWPPPDMDDASYAIAVRDGLCGLALIAAALRVTAAEHRPQVLAGIVGACLPDLDKPGRRFLGRSPWPEWFDRFHVCLQVGVESPHLLRQDVLVSAAGAVVALAVLSRRSSAYLCA